MNVSVNNRTYQITDTPVVGICLDGTSQDYLDAAIMPNLQRMMARGSHALVKTVIPSFTNPNNVAIVTGAPPGVNGICGNYYFDPELNEEAMMDHPRYLRSPTILSAFAESGKSVGVVTTKDKLRKLLTQGLNGACFSVEAVQQEWTESPLIERIITRIGRAPPGIYEPEISVYCLEAGRYLIEDQQLDLVYLTTTDFVQHKYKPGSGEANQFLAQLDNIIGEIDALGVILGITADHGMNDKVKPDGSPNVQFIESILKEEGIDEARVILPITDPYVVHHGALGSYATVYVDDASIPKAKEMLAALPGIELVLTKEAAVRRFELPADRIGQLVVLADQATVIGRTPDWHDLTVVEQGLRSHGGLHEGEVPMIINRQLKDDYARRLASGEAHNYDLFEILCNGTRG